MRSDLQPVNQKKLSFIEEARRRQIVETAIQTIATQGFSQASLAEIARKAGISKGVISYHFAGKDELVEEILRSLLHQPAEFIKQRVGHHETALEQLRAYIEANFEFMESHRDNYVALVDLWGRRGSAGEENRFNAEAYEPSRHYLAHMLEAGRERGEFRHLPVRATASLIQASIDGVMLQWVFDEDSIDLDVCRAEVLEMVTRHVSKGDLR
jgi:TetR/AcrR family fatty acid metabolism transcriptional regulator